jgi:hypothetical protein
MIALGLVINPKLKVPVVAVADDREIHIYGLPHVDEDGDDEEWEQLGRGYYGEDTGSHVTGMPRSHTPNRSRRGSLIPNDVDIKGAGYGTSLYTSLCLGAHQNHEFYDQGAKPRFRFSRNATSDGISSMEGTRSDYADDWWEAARRRRLTMVQEEDSTEENVDVTSEFSDNIEGSEYGSGTISNVNTIDVDVTTVAQIDIYPFENALKHNLIIASFTVELDGESELPDLWRKLQNADIHEAYPHWLLAIDVRGLTLDAINLLGVIGQESGLSEQDLSNLRYRWEHQIDPSMPVPQIVLPFKPNSSAARDAMEAVEQAAEIRQASGWDELADLP